MIPYIKARSISGIKLAFTIMYDYLRNVIYDYLRNFILVYSSLNKVTFP